MLNIDKVLRGEYAPYEIPRRAEPAGEGAVECAAMKIEGHAGGAVFVDGQALDPGPSLAMRNHSPTGFAWGYEGSGPAQLALALLLHAGANAGEALDWYQDFKRQVVAHWPHGEPFEWPVEALEGWIAERRTPRPAPESVPEP